MKVYDAFSKQMFRGTLMVNDGQGIRIYNKENDLLATVPKNQAKLIFNENDMPYMEEVE